MVNVAVVTEAFMQFLVGLPRIYAPHLLFYPSQLSQRSCEVAHFGHGECRRIKRLQIRILMLFGTTFVNKPSWGWQFKLSAEVAYIKYELSDKANLLITLK